MSFKIFVTPNFCIFNTFHLFLKPKRHETLAPEGPYFQINFKLNKCNHSNEQYGGFKHNRQNEGRKAGMRRRSLSQGHQKPLFLKMNTRLEGAILVFRVLEQFCL